MLKIPRFRNDENGWVLEIAITNSSTSVTCSDLCLLIYLSQIANYTTNSKVGMTIHVISAELLSLSLLSLAVFMLAMLKCNVSKKLHQCNNARPQLSKTWYRKLICIPKCIIDNSLVVKIQQCRTLTQCGNNIREKCINGNKVTGAPHHMHKCLAKRRLHNNKK